MEGQSKSLSSSSTTDHHNSNVERDESDSNRQLQSQFPVAVLREQNSGVIEFFRASYMWLVALICLITAFGFVFWSRSEQGLKISIQFPEGHGLEAEDSVRFRGIDVGVVHEVKLSSDMDGVEVIVSLFPAAEPLARDGSRFWIVRPELDFGGISGIETAVGHKYIAVTPGNREAPFKNEFNGLPSSPPGAFENRGVEIILRGEKKYSIAPDSPVTYRGVMIGRVLSVDLEPEGRFVDIRAKIFEDFQNFLTTKSKFWPASGIDVEMSFTTGMKLNTESIETLLRGGVSVLTPENGGDQIQPGQQFPLAGQAEEEWFESAKQVRATDVKMRGAVPMQTRWVYDGIFDRSKDATFVATVIRSGSENSLLIPTDTLVVPPKTVDNSFQIGILDDQASFINPSESTPEGKLQTIQLESKILRSSQAFQRRDFRKMSQPERCLAVRSATSENEGSSLEFFHYPIQADEIDNENRLTHFNGDRSVWHGAPVLATSDGRLIGILMVSDQDARIEPIPDSVF
ncbi:MAG: MlaD family protein [Planctomycetota bacterium]